MIRAARVQQNRLLGRKVRSDLTSKRDAHLVILETIGDSHYRVHHAGVRRTIQGANRARRIAEWVASKANAQIIFVGE